MATAPVLLTVVVSDYRVAQYYKMSGHQKIRVLVVVDFYSHQSLATVDLMTPSDGWTELISLPPDLWWQGRNKTDKTRVADELLTHAVRILEV